MFLDMRCALLEVRRCRSELHGTLLGSIRTGQKPPELDDEGIAAQGFSYDFGLLAARFHAFQSLLVT